MKNNLWSGSGSAGGEETERQEEEAGKRGSGEAEIIKEFLSPFLRFSVSPSLRMILLSKRG
jgi:hypothetical protein